jgi:succinoglycan biosynthesis protein ExoA
MSQESPRISIVIAARKDQSTIPALTALKAFSKSAIDFEVLLVRGKQPSRQRNQAVQSASADILYFLDDDSEPVEGNLERLVNAFLDPNVAVLGGPNLCPKDASFLQRVFSGIMGSWLAFGPSYARYRQVGELRSSSEKELILCNMAIRTRDFVEAKGFDESLYPNEENALLDEISKRGRQILYDPTLLIHRYPRETISEFVRMLYRYGRGRGEQVRLYPSKGSLLNFVPALFVIFVLGCSLIGLLPESLRLFFWIPIVAYILLSIRWGLGRSRESGTAMGICSIPFLPIAHIAYGLGLWKGLIMGPQVTDKGKRDLTVAIEKVDLFCD